MLSSKLRTRALGAGAVVATVGGVAFSALGWADPSHAPNLSHVPSANQKAAGYAPASRLSAELQQITWAQGSTRLENPKDIVSFYGYENDVPSADNPAFPQMLPTTANPTEAQKTEPDKNTYLEFKKGLSGPDESYDYGAHFLYQGHELAATVAGKKRGYITRVNLDADAQHRVTLMASEDDKGEPIATIDGSTWDPFARRLLFTTESAAAPTYAATAEYPSKVEDVSGALGRGGYEGIQNDSDGNLWIVEDIGGANKQGTTARQPNSFVFRYVPRHPGDLHNGRLQALQVLNKSGQPMTFESQAPLQAPDQVEAHSYGNKLDTRWVVVHDTAAEGGAPFNANAAAKAAHATPFKRPENGLFRPGSRFTEFYFDETGDTNATSPENPTAGGWGVVQKLEQSGPSANTGKLRLFYYGDQEHSGLDNNAFLSRDKVTFVEDAGDTLHKQRDALDSGYVFDVGTDYSKPSNQPVRWLAEGRDASATIDSDKAGFGKNDGDNEITGTQVSDGDPGPQGILGARTPTLFRDGWRWFYT
ncbi:MAG: phosphatase, partial [Actinomycetota bacterium]|nr:phosphatase [Actinomycetota bacterium]